jgi:ribosomal protein S12 methylthiotransferase
VLVNTCGFIEAAKQESIAELLDGGRPGAQVVAAGCLAERYGAQLAEALPEAEVLSFDDYTDIGGRLDALLAGQRRPAHQPRDRRRLLPISPVRRPGAGAVHVPGHGMPGPARSGAGPGAVPGAGSAIPDLPPGTVPPSGPRVLRRRLDGGPVAPLKIASGCDRRCSFCAIPAYRGAFLSRPPQDVLAEAEWLAGQGVRELLLVSENSTSYGKDLGNLRLLDELLPALATIPGIARIRVTYLQPAELRPGLIEVIATTPGVVPYFDLSFQHASGRVLRAMRRFGDRARFCALLDQIRQACPEAGARSNFIVGFPGEDAEDLAELERFLGEARLDAIGIFGYSDEDGTEAATLGGQLDSAEIARRADDLSDLAEEVMAQRAAERCGETVDVLIEEHLGEGRYQGRAAHQAPEVDGVTTVRSLAVLSAGDIISAKVVASEGVDLVAEALDSAAARTPERAGMR